MRFYKMNKEAIDAHGAPYKVTGLTKVHTVQYPKDIYAYNFTGHGGYDERENSLKDGNNSGFASLHLAIKLGAPRIVLMGYDFKFNADNKSHWHEGHCDEMGRAIRHTPETFSKRMLPYFKSLVPKVEELGVEIINANPDSLLDIWPRRSIEDVI